MTVDDKIDSTHPEYDANTRDRTLLIDCIAGSQAIKSKNELYLPVVDNDGTQDSIKKYRDYLKRAVFFPVVSNTLGGLVSAVYRVPPQIKMHNKLEFLVDDADGCGHSLVQSIKETLAGVIGVGRSCLLVDYPETDGQIKTLAQKEQNRLRPTIKIYDSASVINWHLSTVGALQIVDLIVLHEPKYEQSKESIYEYVSKDYYRVLRLIEGEYWQFLYEKVSDNEFELLSEYRPLQATGRPFNEIPFVFIGSDTLTSSVDRSPLLDIAEINIAHYRNSADLEQAGFMSGQPTTVITGMSHADTDELENNGGFKLGSHGVNCLPVDATAQFLEVSENQLLLTLMEKKEEQMRALNARITRNQTNGVEAAETVKIRQSTETSKLAHITSNVAEGYIIACKYTAKFEGVESQSIAEIMLNTDYFDTEAEPQSVQQIINLVVSELISVNDARNYLRRNEIIEKTRTNEDIQKDIDLMEETFSTQQDNQNDQL